MRLQGVDQIVEPGSAEWRAYLERLLERRVTMSPTFNIYSAGRDVMRARKVVYFESQKGRGAA